MLCERVEVISIRKRSTSRMTCFDALFQLRVDLYIKKKITFSHLFNRRMKRVRCGDGQEQERVETSSGTNCFVLHTRLGVAHRLTRLNLSSFPMDVWCLLLELLQPLDWCTLERVTTGT